MARSYEREARSLNFDHHIPVFNLQRIHCNLRARVMRSLASLRIPLPAVPGTDHLVAFNHSLPQRPAAMQADVVHGGDRPIHIGDADDFVAERKFFGFAYREEVQIELVSFMKLAMESFEEVQNCRASLGRAAWDSCPHVVSLLR